MNCDALRGFRPVRGARSRRRPGIGRCGAIAATLTTLAECLPAGEARSLAAQLPLQLQAPLATGPVRPQVISVQQFLRRVAEREQVSPSEALHHARAVMDALTEAVSVHELQGVRGRLPDEFETLFKPPAAARWPQTHRHRPHM